MADSILTINGGSSSIKMALFETGSLRRISAGKIERTGEAGSTAAKGVDAVIDWVGRNAGAEPSAIGHRIVHGGAEFAEPVRLTPDVLDRLRSLIPYDPEHLVEETCLAEAFLARFPKRPQIACFDTAFHHDLPRIAQLLPIPRRYFARGVRRYGFHGLSYAYLLEELGRQAGPAIAGGRVVLAHLGNGASMAAVSGGRPIDTTMAFTPTAGLPMGSRAGDLDPGLVGYLGRTEHMDPERFTRWANFDCGLLGVSEISSDLRDLERAAPTDPRAEEALGLFAYAIKKTLGSFAAALGGLDAVVFAGGIGEKSSEVRSRACSGLNFLGLELDPGRNAAHAALISTDHSRVQVRVIPTDEELVIARSVARFLDQPKGSL